MLLDLCEANGDRTHDLLTARKYILAAGEPGNARFEILYGAKLYHQKQK